jgi:fumarate reductase flavoprotein subunit
MMRSHHIAVITVLAFIMVLVMPLTYLWAAGPEAGEARAAPEGKAAFLADRHKDAGVDCSGCHKESPPTEAPPMEACLKCHGPYEKLATRSEKLEQNPHASHLGELECSNCHHGHKTSVDYCARCHTFGFRVP